MTFSAVRMMILVLISFAIVVPASAKDFALYISFEDGIGFTESAIQDDIAFIQENSPELEVHSIVVKDFLFRAHLPGASIPLRRSFKKQIAQFAAAMGPDDRIKLLVLGTHGISLFNSRTYLQFFGGFTKSGVNWLLKFMLSPLQGRLATDARVVLNSCSTMCGTHEEAAQRAGVLLKYLGVTEGSLFALHVAGVMNDQSRWPSLRFLASSAVISYFNFRLLQVVGYPVVVAAQLLTSPSDSSLMNAGSNLFGTSVSIYDWTVALAAAIPWATTRTFIVHHLRNQAVASVSEEGSFNRGRVYLMEEDGVYVSSDINSYAEKKLVFSVESVRCEQVLSTASKNN